MKAGLFFQLFVSSFATGMCVFVVFMGVSRSIATSALEEEKITDTAIIVERTDQYLDQTIQNLKNILLLMASDQRLLDATDTDKLKTLLEAYLNNSSSLALHMYIRTKDGAIVTNRQALYDAVGNEGLLGYLEELRTTGALGYVLQVSEPYYSRLCADTTILFVMPVRAGSRLVDLVAVEIDVAYLTTRLAAVMSSIPGSFMLFSAQGNLISSHTTYEPLLDMQSFPNQIKGDILRLLSRQGTGSRYLNLVGSDILFTARDDNQLGWKLALLVERSSYLAKAARLSNVFLLLILLSIPLYAFMVLLVSTNFTKPIRRLSRIMDNLGMELSLPGLDSLVARSDEVGHLARSFQDSVQRIGALHEKQKEILDQRRILEIQSLQDQIHPHFLSNTLACIVSLIRLGHTSQAQEALRLLLTLLNYGMERTHESATFGEELDFIHSYCRLQRIRHGDNFKLDIQVAPEHRGLALPKLILQPLVENALFHGLSFVDEGVLTIGSVLEGNLMHIRIHDNGCGMEEPKVAALMRAMANGAPAGESAAAAAAVAAPGAGGRIGIRNTDKRIKLFFGDGYGLSISSSPGAGTSVEIRVPFDPGAAFAPGAPSPAG